MGLLDKAKNAATTVTEKAKEKLGKKEEGDGEEKPEPQAHQQEESVQAQDDQQQQQQQASPTNQGAAAGGVDDGGLFGTEPNAEPAASSQDPAPAPPPPPPPPAEEEPAPAPAPPSSAPPPSAPPPPPPAAEQSSHSNNSGAFAANTATATTAHNNNNNDDLLFSSPETSSSPHANDGTKVTSVHSDVEGGASAPPLPHVPEPVPKPSGGARRTTSPAPGRGGAGDALGWQEEVEVMARDFAHEKASLGDSILPSGTPSMIKDKVLGHLREIFTDTDAWVDARKEEARAFKAEAEAKLRKFFDELKEKMMLWVLERVEDLLAKGLDRLLPTIRRKLKDPYMPGCLQNSIDTIIDGAWADVRMEVIETILGALRPRIPKYVTDDNSCCGCWRSFRTFVRYHLYPYNKSIFQQLRDPWFILFCIICLIPIPGLLQFMWFWVLICIDREDEYQLLQYIWDFKKLQFLTIGCIKIIIGSASFYRCTVNVPSDCKERWTIAAYDAFGLVFLIVHIFVVWFVYTLLPASKQKGSYHRLLRESHDRRGIKMDDAIYEEGGRQKVDPEAGAEEDEAPKLGHKMMKWLIYDMVVFLICLGLGLWAMFGHANSSARVDSDDREGGVVSNWRFTATLYWLQALYGLGAFPFIIFALPLCHFLFTHAKHTGYDEDGDCVPFLGLPPEDADKRREELKAKYEAEKTAMENNEVAEAARQEQQKIKTD